LRRRAYKMSCKERDYVKRVFLKIVEAVCLVGCSMFFLKMIGTVANLHLGLSMASDYLLVIILNAIVIAKVIF